MYIEIEHTPAIPSNGIREMWELYVTHNGRHFTQIVFYSVDEMEDTVRILQKTIDDAKAPERT